MFLQGIYKCLFFIITCYLHLMHMQDLLYLNNKAWLFSPLSISWLKLYLRDSTEHSFSLEVNVETHCIWGQKIKEFHIYDF